MSLLNAVLATIHAETSRPIKGRTLLQKKLYFLGVLCDLDFGFSPYHYGPYSSDVANHLEALVGAAFVSERIESFGGVSKFREIRRYDYDLTDEGNSAVRGQPNEFSCYLAKLKMINNHVIASDAYKISIAAKVHHIVSEGGQASKQDIINRAAKLGWDLSNNDINQVLSYLTQMNLVTTS